MGIGLVLALILPRFPFLNFIFTPILTIVHELGHTVASWLFGYPAYPAFDFQYGGGVTVWNLERGPLIVLGVLAAAGGARLPNAGLPRGLGHPGSSRRRLSVGD